MRGGRRRALAVSATVAAFTVLALAACGTPSADLFVVKRTGSVQGARLDLRVQDGGEVTCNGKSAGMMSSDQLITARELIRELSGGKVDRQNDATSDSGPLDRDLVLPPGRRSILRYELRAEEGTIAYSDSSANQPGSFFKLTRLVRDLAKSVCKLPR